MKKRKDGRYQSSVMLTDPLTNEKRRVYVYGYTEDTIIFKIERDGYDDCYELSFDQSGALNLAYGTSLDVMDDVIVCH